MDGFKSDLIFMHEKLISLIIRYKVCSVKSKLIIYNNVHSWVLDSDNKIDYFCMASVKASGLNIVNKGDFP